MLYTYPDYYEDFKCTAGKCEATCCAGWQIVVDDDSLNRYKKYKGTFSGKLKAGIDWKEGCFKQKLNGRCIFLNKNNLCDMQLNIGEENLCKICREYPRHIEEFENVREISLSVSCPEAAASLLSNTGKVTFYDEQVQGEEVFEDFDVLFYSLLTDARKAIINILQNRELSIDLRMYIVLAIGHDLQGRINRADYYSFQQVSDKYSNPKVWGKVQDKLNDYKKNSFKQFCYNRLIFKDIFKLEHIYPLYGLKMRRAYTMLFGKRDVIYSREDRLFRKWCQENIKGYEIKLEQLLVYFIFTYFCGSVYDGDVYGKVYMSVISVFIINELIKAKWIEQNGYVCEHDIIKIVYSYSRELEHSDINLDRFENFARTFSVVK